MIDIEATSNETKKITHTTYKSGNKIHNITIIENTPSDEAIRNFTKELLRLMK